MIGRGGLVLATLLALSATIPAGAQHVEVPSVLGQNARRLDNGHYELRLADGTTLTTHGPDPVPNHGSGLGLGDPERPPICATDYYQHVLYGRRNGTTDRLESVRATIQASMRRINALLDEEAAASGDVHADYKVLCDDTGEIKVDGFVANGTTFDSVVDGAQAAGFGATNADYTIFFDATYSGVCGVGSLTFDDRASASNLNNSGGDYAVAYNNCWTNETPMHENGHNQGAVQQGAPYSTGSGAHCIDDLDVMCYSPDGGNQNQGGTFNRCTDRVHFDCGNDTYFDAAPEGNEWLATHWNIGSPMNRFITFSTLERPPRTGFSTTCAGTTCSFGDLTTDEGSLTSWAWDFGDGQTSVEQSPTHTFAADGAYVVTLTATDNDAATSSSEQVVVLPADGDPDAATPTLQNGVVKNDTNGGGGTWRVYKIFVPQSRQALTVRLDGPSCTLPVFCNPDLDLFVRQGQPPDTGMFACSSEDISNDETCVVNKPGPGYWYVGVYTFFGAPGPAAQLSRVAFRVTATS